ncbi:MAG: exodeoxyribonuclease V subunit alpha [Puniceicoccales bacterium]|jgi:exodeoxyribonuclease V alpha subunit|nr:exodeoxyribonuclease V subunit alpha [Puniceicoccales bacterium]
MEFDTPESVLKHLDALAGNGALSPFAPRFADAVARLAPKPDGAPPALLLAAGLAAHNTVANKHSCLDLKRVRATGDVLGDTAGGTVESKPLPAKTLSTLSERRCRFAVADASAGTGAEPLVLEGARLYLRRYWALECQLARTLRGRAAGARNPTPAEIRRVRALAPRLDDAQAEAAARALANPLTVITGGPGTGKTTVVCAMLAALLDDATGATETALCAPTGKAAARLKEAIAEGLPRLALPADSPARAALAALEPATAHRLLGADPSRGNFARNARNPIAADVLVADECSMFDLPLLAALLDAAPAARRIVLLGDKDQLSAVETGAALADICAAWGRSPALAALTRSHRFPPEGGIARLRDAINAGDAAGAWEILAACRDAAGGDLSLAAPPANARDLEARLAAHLRDHPLRAYQEPGIPPAEALRRLERFRVLCATRADALSANAAIERALNAGDGAHGHPFLIVENDYENDLRNGDTGLLLRGGDGVLRAWFADPSAEGGARPLAPSRLPAREGAFALTVHKAQGSAFDETLLALPARAPRSLTRELLYTGLTRARHRCVFWTGEGVFRHAVEARADRDSGLAERLGAGGTFGTGGVSTTR